MNFPVADLEFALAELLRRAARVREAPELYQEIRILREERSAVAKEVGLKRASSGLKTAEIVQVPKNLIDLKASLSPYGVDLFLKVPSGSFHLLELIPASCRLAFQTANLSGLERECKAAQSHLYDLRDQVRQIRADLQRLTAARGR